MVIVGTNGVGILNMKIRTLITEITYKEWKRKNVTLRGMKSVGEDNGVYGSLGNGLYTVPLSNKAMAKQYGTVYFVVNAIPKKPKIFDGLNSWEIFRHKLKQKALGLDSSAMDVRDFEKNGHKIEDEMKKMGYDGAIIKGREMVNYEPKDVKYFKTEQELENYFNSVILR
jgi:hypothetical protein